MLEAGLELSIDPYIPFYDPKSVFELDVGVEQVRQAKVITFPHGETYV